MLSLVSLHPTYKVNVANKHAREREKERETEREREIKKERRERESLIISYIYKVIKCNPTKFRERMRERE